MGRWRCKALARTHGGKAKVEAAVLIVERWLFGRLRHRTFHSLAELNAATGELLADLNYRRVLRRVDRTRRQLFEELDRPALKPLPAEAYVYAEWRRRRAGLDYHVEIERHYYSVPYRFAREPVEARITARSIELFHRFGVGGDDRHRLRRRLEQQAVDRRLGDCQELCAGGHRMEWKGPSIWQSTRTCWNSFWLVVTREICSPRTVCSTG